jgi:AraC family transcriptional regulator
MADKIRQSAAGSPVMPTTGRLGSVGQSEGRRLNLRRLDTPDLTAVMTDFNRTVPIVGDWYSDEIHMIDMSLSGRLSGTRGYFADAFSDYQRLGDFCFAPAGYRFHCEGMAGHQQSITLFLLARPLFDDEPEFGQNLAPVLRQCMNLQSKVLRDLILRIACELGQPGFASNLIVEGLGLTLLVEAARLLRTLNADSAHKGGLSAWRVKIIKDRVRSGAQHPTLNELAGLCGLSRRHLVRAFRQETGESIGAFVQSSMMERARTLLRESHQPVKAVATNSGFSNPAAFSAAFRRASGQTPRSFRAACQGIGQPREAHTNSLLSRR